MGPIADSSVAISAGSGTPIRVLTALGAGSADQQVITLADSAGTLLGTAAVGVPVRPQTSTTGTITSVSSTVTANTTLLASNANRLGATIYNESTAILFIAFGATCGPTLTPTTYTVQILPGGYYELTAPAVIYTGIITCTWSAANGSARITELT